MSQEFTQAVVLDFEATCEDRRLGHPLVPQEIIELPSVLVDLAPRRVVAEFEAFVRPRHHPRLTPFCTQLTAITQADVDQAPFFNEVLAAHGRWLDEHGLSEDNSLIVTCGDWDLKTMFPEQCRVADPPVTDPRAIYTRWLNIKHMFCQVQRRSKAPGMARMLRRLDLPLVGHHHRGIDDCRNIARILLSLLEGGGRFEVSGSVTVFPER